MVSAGNYHANEVFFRLASAELMAYGPEVETNRGSFTGGHSNVSF
jgi:hypothetical protein